MFNNAIVVKVPSPQVDPNELDSANMVQSTGSSTPCDLSARSSANEALSMSRRRLASNRPSFALKRILTLPRYPSFKLQVPSGQAKPTTPLFPVTPLERIMGAPAEPPQIDAFSSTAIRGNQIYTPSPGAELSMLHLPRRLSYSAYHMGMPTPTTPYNDGINVTLASPVEIDQSNLCQ